MLPHILFTNAFSHWAEKLLGLLLLLVVVLHWLSPTEHNHSKIPQGSVGPDSSQEALHQEMKVKKKKAREVGLSLVQVNEMKVYPGR